MYMSGSYGLGVSATLSVFTTIKVTEHLRTHTLSQEFWLKLTVWN